METWEASVPQEAEAAPGGWFTCTITAAGPTEDGSIWMQLREVGGQWERWYSPVSLVKKEMLATALTAITMGVPVLAALSTTDEWGPIERLYIVP